MRKPKTFWMGRKDMRDAGGTMTVTISARARLRPGYWLCWQTTLLLLRIAGWLSGIAFEEARE